MTTTPAFPELAAIRLGYGLSPTMPAPADARAVLDSVAQSITPDGWTTQAADDAQHTLGQARKRHRDGDISDEDYRATVQDLNRQRLLTLQRRIGRAAGAPIGFGERLVQFWTDHFTTIAQNAPQQIMAAAMVDEAIRPHLAGSFADLLFAAETHPMMLRFLEPDRQLRPEFGVRAPPPAARRWA